MPLFSRPEWTNFLISESKRPFRWPSYFFVIAKLFLRRLFNVYYLKWRSYLSPHLGLKTRPKWLKKNTFFVKFENIKELNFPKYPILNAHIYLSENYLQTYHDDDFEKKLADHRWQDSFLAAFVGNCSPEKALFSAMTWLRNPPSMNDPSWETYSASERAVNLAVLLAKFPALWKSLSEEDKKIIVNFFQQSINWIGSRLEFYGTRFTNNHILNNARALVISGALLNKELIVEQSLYLCLEMSKELFQPSGSLRERSTHYQWIVTNWMMDMVAFSKPLSIDNLNIAKAHEKLVNLSKKALQTSKLLHIAYENLGSLVGDISPDHHPLASIDRLSSLYSKEWAREVNLSGFLHFDDWVLLRYKNNMLLASIISGNYPALYTTHGHDDFSNLLWSNNNIPILVDSGRYDYRLEGPGLLQRSSWGHNVIMIEGLSALARSVLLNGQWLPMPYSSMVNIINGSSRQIIIEHNGFERISGVGNHKRSATLEANELVIIDEISGSGSLIIDLFWHFAPGWSPVNRSSLLMANENYKLSIDINWSSTNYKKAWKKFPFSLSYGDKKNCNMLKVTGKTDLPSRIVTRMRTS